MNLRTSNLHIIEKVWINLCRFVLGGTFIFSGFVKAIDPLGFFYKLQDYLEAFGLASLIPQFLPLLFAIGEKNGMIRVTKALRLVRRNGV